MKRILPRKAFASFLLLFSLVTLTGCTTGSSQGDLSGGADSGGYSDTEAALNALELTSDQIDQGYEFLGDEDRIAYRWLTKAEFKDLSCDSEWCSYIYVISNDECLSVDVTYDAKDTAGVVLETQTRNVLTSGDPESGIAAGSPQTLYLLTDYTNLDQFEVTNFECLSYYPGYDSEDLGDGPIASNTVTMPNFIGQIDGDVQQILQSNGLSFSYGFPESTGFNPQLSCLNSGNNVVVDQSPQPGSEVANDSTTRLRIFVNCEW